MSYSLKSLYDEIQLIEDAEEKEAIQFIFNVTGADVCLGFLNSLDFMAIMLDKNKDYSRIEEAKLSSFFQDYEQKMLASGGN